MELTSLNQPDFCLHSLNKYASLLTSGNGYMGIRASLEEPCLQQTRGTYLAGLYHCAGKGETSELVNLPDVVGVQIQLDNDIFSLLSGETESWQRELNFATGELTRAVVWRAPNGARFRLESCRFASMAQLPLFAMRLTITPLDADATVSLTTGIDATQTNSGRQHLDEVQVRVFGEHFLQGVYATQDGSADIAISSWCQVSGKPQRCFAAKNRQLTQNSVQRVAAGESITLEKLSWIAWRDDRREPSECWAQQCLSELERCVEQGYDALRAASDAVWQAFWQRSRVTVNAEDPRDQQALDYALYHLQIMTPIHDERSSIGAKGLTGEGYKGHVFWDTEVFLLPFHLFTQPDIARRLLRYRWHNLPGARKKAQQNGWHGALFPWESARSGDEETPEFAAINIRTGVRQKVASALAEHHLVADIAWAVVQYWHATGDEAFMSHEGTRLLIETAKFWISRATEVNGRLELHDVIGPDEYTEHVNNNAYTSYLAHENVAQALHFARQYAFTDEVFFARAEDFLARLWRPEALENGVLPQDDSFMAKPAIDLSGYKRHAGKQTILLDYSRAEVNEMQILKQADVVMLTYMLPERFTAHECLANLNFYEPRTIHDSSLSKTIHGIVAAGCGDLAQAYRFWREGTEIDLGSDPHACDDGIHAAATGAIWLGTIQGFAGVSVRGGELHIAPRLPQGWQRLAFPLQWRGVALQIVIEAGQIAICSSAPVELWLNQQLITVAGDVHLSTDGTATTEGQ